MTLTVAAASLAVALVCAYLTQSIVGFTRGGFLISVIMSFLAAVLAGQVAEDLGFPEVATIQIAEETFPIFWAVMGAAAAAMVVGILTPSARR